MSVRNSTTAVTINLLSHIFIKLRYRSMTGPEVRMSYSMWNVLQFLRWPGSCQFRASTHLILHQPFCSPLDPLAPFQYAPQFDRYCPLPASLVVGLACPGRGSLRAALSPSTWPTICCVDRLGGGSGLVLEDAEPWLREDALLADKK